MSLPDDFDEHTRGDVETLRFITTRGHNRKLACAIQTKVKCPFCHHEGFTYTQLLWHLEYYECDVIDRQRMEVK